MSAEVDEEYFVWLCAKVTEHGSVGQTYWDVMRLMYRYEYVWTIVGDANRSSDANELKIEFCRSRGYDPAIFLDYDPVARVSVLEVLVALTRRAEFQTGMSEVLWFRRFLENLSLIDQYDAAGVDPTYVNNILYIFVWRLYNEKGEGGLFPLSYAEEDQRNLELWFQMHTYIDQEMIGG